MDKPRAAVAAIVKNEGPYLLEWIAWHRVLGVDHFILADNDSDDGSSDLLADLHTAGIVTHVPFPGVEGRSPQAAAYRLLLQEYATDLDWVAVIDADEFLHPEDPNFSIQDYLSQTDASTGAIALNWALYGSSGLKEKTEGFVTERFTQRGPQDHPLNRQVKSMVRMDAYAGMLDSHFFKLQPGFDYANSRLESIEVLRDEKRPRVQDTTWGSLRVNHYIVKSLAEFIVKKRSRGRAKVSGSFREMDYFSTHNRNEEQEPVAPELLERVRVEYEALRALSPEHSAKSYWPESADTIVSTYLAEQQPWAGTIDQIAIGRKHVTVSGWAVTNDGQAASNFRVTAGDVALPIESVERKERRDVTSSMAAKGRPNIGRNVGFTLKVATTTDEAEKARKQGGAWVIRAETESRDNGAVLRFPQSMLFPQP